MNDRAKPGKPSLGSDNPVLAPRDSTTIAKPTLFEQALDIQATTLDLLTQTTNRLENILVRMHGTNAEGIPAEWPGLNMSSKMHSQAALNSYFQTLVNHITGLVNVLEDTI